MKPLPPTQRLLDQSRNLRIAIVGLVAQLDQLSPAAVLAHHDSGFEECTICDTDAAWLEHTYFTVLRLQRRANRKHLTMKQRHKKRLQPNQQKLNQPRDQADEGEK